MKRAARGRRSPCPRGRNFRRRHGRMVGLGRARKPPRKWSAGWAAGNGSRGATGVSGLSAGGAALMSRSAGKHGAGFFELLLGLQLAVFLALDFLIGLESTAGKVWSCDSADFRSVLERLALDAAAAGWEKRRFWRIELRSDVVSHRFGFDFVLVAGLADAEGCLEKRGFFLTSAACRAKKRPLAALAAVRGSGGSFRWGEGFQSGERERDNMSLRQSGTASSSHRVRSM